MDFDYLIFIGRFQPFHHGHKFVVQEALKRANTVIMLIGSANSPRTIKNPFTFDEREAMILSAFEEADAARIVCLPIEDTMYNDNKWLQNIGQAVSLVSGGEGRIGVIGHTKDDSSYYLSLFPMWGYVELPNFQNLSATPLRKAFFDIKDKSDALPVFLHENLPPSSLLFLQKFMLTSDFDRLQGEYLHVLKFQESWKNAPYPPVFVTCDALVVQSGHVLLVERGGEYGRGLWALAGGFLDGKETLADCVVRELQEETGLVLPKNTHKSITVFDAPDRSARGRTVTHVFHFELTGGKLPAVAGGDDASRAFWLPLDKLDGTKMFEDHYSIITKVLGL